MAFKLLVKSFLALGLSTEGIKKWWKNFVIFSVFFNIIPQVKFWLVFSFCILFHDLFSWFFFGLIDNQYRERALERRKLSRVLWRNGLYVVQHDDVLETHRLLPQFQRNCKHNFKDQKFYERV